MKKRHTIKELFLALIILHVGGLCYAGTLFTESFDNSAISSRGWFDGSAIVIDTSVKYGGGGSVKWTWSQGATNPTGTQTIRHDFTATDSLYVSFYWRFNSDWGAGSGLSYHPHIIYVLSDADNHWGSLASNVLDTYIEAEGLVPIIHLQDAANINTSPTPPWTNTMGTENRAIAGCNGDTVGADASDDTICYQSGGWLNGKYWKGSSNFQKSVWHHNEVYLKMNSVSNGIGQTDGIMQVRVDGVLVINKSNIIYRTNQHPDLKWRTLVLAPYIGVNAPQNETMWMDELTVGTDDPYETPMNKAPSPPQHLVITGHN
jgi:hypothetical protein